MLSYIFLISCFLCALQAIALGSPTHLKSHDWLLKRGRSDRVEHQDFSRRQGYVRKSVRSTDEDQIGGPANRIASAPVATRNENTKPKNRITWNDLVHEIGTINNKAAEKRENSGSTSGEKEVTSNPAGVSSAGAQLAPGHTLKPVAGGGACAGGAGGAGAGGAGAGAGGAGPGPCAGKCPSSSTEKASLPPVGNECPANLDTMFVCPKCRTHYTVKINVRESKCGHCCGVPIPCCDDAKVSFAGPSDIENLIQPGSNQIANFQQVQTRARKQMMKRNRFQKQDSKRAYSLNAGLHQHLSN